jgi:hypothetical protein
MYQNDSDLRQDFLKTAYECELLVNKLLSMDKNLEQSSKLIISNSNQNNIESCKLIRANLGKQLNEKLNVLSSKINKILVEKVADDFVDINYPLKKMNEVIKSMNTGKYISFFYYYFYYIILIILHFILRF